MSLPARTPKQRRNIAIGGVVGVGVVLYAIFFIGHLIASLPAFGLVFVAGLLVGRYGLSRKP